MIADFAALALAAALATACIGVATSLHAGVHGTGSWRMAGDRALRATVLLVAGATVILWILLMQDRFEVLYVWSSSEAALPLFYKFAALWGGQAGSLLFWAFILACGSLLAVRRVARTLPDLTPWTTAVLCANLAFFLLLVVVPANPFQRIPFPPPDGAGLNPLLQNYWMVIHPVMLYLGYVGLTVPFSLAVAALAVGRMDTAWLRMLRRWTLVPWLFLSVGILMGSQWAYMELGWGGYWAWDPVENASLLPWLTATAFLHGLVVQEQRGTMRLWNMVMIGLTYFLVLLGTFTTRSDIVASVHTFARSSIGLYFVGFMALTAVGFPLLLWVRRTLLTEPAAPAAWLSRETAFLANNWLLGGIAFATLWGTYFPVFGELLAQEQVAVAAPYFQKVNGPLFLLLLLFMGVGPLLGWRFTRLSEIWRKLRVPLAGALLLALASLFLLPPDPFAAAGLFVCFLALLGVLQEFADGIRARRRARTEHPLTSLKQLLVRQGRRYGGYLVHVGIVCMGVAIVGNEFHQEVRHITLERGRPDEFGRWTVTFIGLAETEQANLTEYRAYITVHDRAGNLVTRLEPRRNVYHKTPEAPTSEVGLHMSLREDLYVVLNGWQDEAASATFSFFLNPLMIWLWIGGVILVFGTLVALWPHGPPPGRQARA